MPVDKIEPQIQSLPTVKRRVEDRSFPERNERAAEYGFVLSRLVGSTILDVGHVEGTMLDIVPNAFGVDQRSTGKYPGRECIADLVSGLPFASNRFETVMCVSTLEHMGMGHYGDKAYESDCVDRAFRELARITARRLIITVPLNILIPGFVQELSEELLIAWDDVIPLKELKIFVWPEPIGRHGIKCVAGAMYEFNLDQR